MPGGDHHHRPDRHIGIPPVFRQINCVRIPAGSFTFLGPLCVVQFTNYLPAVVATLIAGRLAETLAYLVICLVKIPALRTARPAWDLAGLW